MNQQEMWSGTAAAEAQCLAESIEALSYAAQLALEDVLRISQQAGSEELCRLRALNAQALLRLLDEQGSRMANELDTLTRPNGRSARLAA